MNNPIIEALYDKKEEISASNLSIYQQETERKHSEYPFLGQLQQFEVKSKFMSRMSEYMIQVYQKTHTLYKFLNAEIDTGDDLILVRQKPDSKSEMFKIQIKPITYKAAYSGRKETWSVNSKRNHYAKKKQYTKYDFDFLITLDRDTEEFYIFDNKALLSSNGYDLITKIVVKSPKARSRFYKENWGILLPELLEE